MEAIRVYFCRFEGLDAAGAAALLTPERAARLHGAGADARAAAGLLLRRACLELTGQVPAHEARASGGKPYLPAQPDFFFSLSHSGGAALCAAGFSPVGADLQRVRPLTEAMRARFFSEEERALCSCGEDFIRLFCARESYGKLTGRGLSRADTVRSCGGALHIGERPIAEPRVPAGFRAAVCADAPVEADVRILSLCELFAV